MDSKAAEQLIEDGDSLITCQNHQGIEIRATLLRITRHLAVFEIYDHQLVLRLSEVLSDFRVLVSGRPVYLGRAVVTSIVHAGTLLVCEASLEDSWIETEAFVSLAEPTQLRNGFEGFMRQWEKTYRILPEYKLLIADMHSYLTDLRLWLDQVEMGVRSSPSGDRLQLEREAVTELAKPVIPALNALFGKFEHLAEQIPSEQQPPHHSYIKRHIHPLVLCSPFAYRTFTKPLGYAGDYEMVNMILRDAQEGGSLFAKVLNAWFVSQPPAEAHRNRIRYLTEKLVHETARVRTEGRPARIYNLGCGPAREVQDFFAAHEISNSAQFVLLDFNDETLQYAQGVIEEVRQRHNRRTPLQWVKKSVVQLLKGAAKVQTSSTDNKHDFVYCAGLFDYLPDRLCKDLMNVFYRMLAPGGLLLVTNVDTSNPIRHMLDYLLEWHLIYRTGRDMLALRPDEAQSDHISISSDSTGVNVFMEVRRPA
jgi:extracellular factor (EF) 3-hydroxypalmitic acid methyl ester biosynthesis protein